MSEIRKTLGIDRVGIKRVNDFKKWQIWADQLVLILEENHKLQRDVVQGATAAETPNWTIRESTAADVTAGESKAVGNLIVVHKTSGAKWEHEAT